MNTTHEIMELIHELTDLNLNIAALTPPHGYERTMITQTLYDALVVEQMNREDAIRAIIKSLLP